MMVLKSNIGSVFACIGFLFLSCIELVSAAPLNYNESIDGDIRANSTLYASTVFDFDIGSNTVSGNSHIYTSTSVPANTSTHDPDSFFFTLPAGSELIAVSYAYSNLDMLPDTSTLLTRFHLSNETGSLHEYFTIDFIDDASPLSAFTSSLPTGENIYKMDNDGYAVTIVGGGSWDYTWTFDVVAVPIPAAVWLFGSGLIGLIGIARRKKA